MVPFVDLAAQQERIKADLDKRIAAVLAHQKFILGPEVQELEEKLAAYVGVKHCITCASGTDALLIALMALGIDRGDEVITTAFTYVATGEVIARIGARPVFVDIDPRTYNINPDKIEAAITDKTKAIMPVSLYGQCADFGRINEIARRYNLPVIEDGAQSFGATRNGKRSCGLSTIGCTSFFPTKPLGCYGDGGACFTDDDELAKAMVIIHKHGQDRRYHHIRMGLNSRLDTLQAAVLLAKLEQFDEEMKSRRAIGELYTEKLKGIDGIETPYIEEGNESVYAQYTIRVDDREALQAALKERGIPTAVHYPIPLNEQPMFEYLGEKFDVPEAKLAAKRVVSLPMSAWMEERTIDTIVRAVRNHLSSALPTTSSHQRKVLMIAYSFPPISGSGVFRSLAFAKYLPMFDWKPTVVATSSPPNRWKYEDKSLEAEIPGDIDVFRIYDKFDEENKKGHSSQRINEVLSFLFNVINNDKEAAKLFMALCESKETLMRLIGLPCKGLSWACDVYRYIDKNIDVGDFDLCYTTSGPYSTQLVGYYLQKKYGIPWVADYRDQWSDNPAHKYDFKNNPQDKLFWLLENVLLHQADCNITMADELVPTYIAHFGLSEEKIVSITNGYDEANFSKYPAVVSKTKKFTISYSGIIYAGRSFDTLFKALNQLCSEGYIEKDKLQFIFSGHSRTENVADLSRKYGLESIVINIGYVSHQRAIQQIIESDLLLSLTRDRDTSKNVYTGKIFNYLRSGRPILALAPHGGVIERTLQETGHGKVFLHSELDGIKAMILDEYRKWEASDHSERMYSPLIKKFERKYLTSKLAELFNAAIKHTN